MNFVKEGQKVIKYEGNWRQFYDTDNPFNKLDMNNKPFPFPKSGKWKKGEKNVFLIKLMNIQNEYAKIKNIDFEDYNENCILCGENNIFSHYYLLDDICWQNGYSHYIDAHNIKPTKEFMQFIEKVNSKKLVFDKIQKKKWIIKEYDWEFLDHIFHSKTRENPTYFILKNHDNKFNSYQLFNDKISKILDIPIPMESMNGNIDLLGKVEIKTNKFKMNFKIPSYSDLNLYIIYRNDRGIRYYLMLCQEGLYIISDINKDKTITLTKQQIMSINEKHKDILDKIKEEVLNEKKEKKLKKTKTGFERYFRNRILDISNGLSKYNLLLHKFNLKVVFVPRQLKNDKYMIKSINLI